jgi:hypothetical protein
MYDWSYIESRLASHIWSASPQSDPSWDGRHVDHVRGPDVRLQIRGRGGPVGESTRG